MPKKIVIIGSGLIGCSWAMLYAALGDIYKITIYDIEKAQIETALRHIKQELESLEAANLLRGSISASQQFATITGCSSLMEAVKNADFIQECVPENLQLKQQVWSEIDALCQLENCQTIFATSTSTFLPSLLSENLKNRENFLVAHPVNPPYYVPLIEIVPAPWTLSRAVTTTKNQMEKIGQVPVCLKMEVPGFIVNRLQYALLNESWDLLKNDVINVQDLDKVMSQGLGMRYAFLGPMETTHLNAEGFRNYCERYASTIYAVSRDFAVPEQFSGELVGKIATQLEAATPLDQLEAKRKWRDSALIRLSQFKKCLETGNKK